MDELTKRLRQKENTYSDIIVWLENREYKNFQSMRSSIRGKFARHCMDVKIKITEYSKYNICVNIGLKYINGGVTYSCRHQIFLLIDNKLKLTM